MQRSITALHRLGSRGRARGAALVEGIVVTSMLMTMMAGGLFLHHLYLAQMKAIGDARLAAWSQALKGCNAGVDLGAIWSEAGESSAPIDVDTDSTPSFFGAISHNSGSASESATPHERVGNKSYKLSVEDSVACDEIPQNQRGDVISLIGYVSGNVVPKFF
ncbi:MAG TPA: hypothetical protein VER11_22880 [Polyangiaceae bacterium]|nr:hypothetical protein [Polyangiaceae bacterium]